MTSTVDLLKGIVVETKTQSWTGPLFYSDAVYGGSDRIPFIIHQSYLNKASTILIVGIAAGVTRMALAVIHALGHSFAAVVTFDKGHGYHAAKGACEFLRGFIEAIPVAGRLFANFYVNNGYWWMIKIYNPNAPDGLDTHHNNWVQFKSARPTGYITA